MTMQSQASYMRDQLKFAKEGAGNLAKAGGYLWTRWLEGKQGRCTAAFEREGQRWSLDMHWRRDEPLEALAERIEQMDFMMRVAMREFGALKLGAMAASAKVGTMQ